MDSERRRALLAIGSDEQLTFDQVRQLTQDHRQHVLTTLAITCGAVVLISAVGGLSYGCHRSTTLDKHMAMVGFYDGDERPGMVHWRPIKRVPQESVQ